MHERIVIKTADELATEFGASWRTNITPRWGQNMDFLHGQDVTEELIRRGVSIEAFVNEAYSNTITTHISSPTGNWSVNIIKHCRISYPEGKEPKTIVKQNGLFRI